MGTSDEVLIDRMDKTILKLEQPAQGTCPAHQPLAEGVSLLLQIQRTQLSAPQENKNMIRFGNLTISGGLGITAAAVVYTVLKLHGLIP
jgi:hypothetical protein